VSAPLDTRAMQAIMDGSPFIRFHQMTVETCDAAAETVTVAMPFRPELERGEGTGQFHGGAIASLIDTAGDFALVMALGGGVPTINFRVDYLRPSRGQRLVALAKVRRAGRTVGVVDVDVSDADGKLVAVGRGCYSTTVG
jgi:uncharacterized protein (TIGR00369 family)